MIESISTALLLAIPVISHPVGTGLFSFPIANTQSCAPKTSYKMAIYVDRYHQLNANFLCALCRSDMPTNGYSMDESVYTRLAAHIELLTSRGLKTEAMWPQWCSQNPGKCL